MALSVASKLLPLMFLPAILSKLGWKKFIGYSIVLGIVLSLCFSPLVFESLESLGNIRESLDLYLKKFEFNAGPYYFLRAIGYQLYGFNMIHVLGPIMSIATLIGILYMSWRKKLTKPIDLIQVMLFSFTLFLLLSRTVHPWYVCTIVFLGTLTNFRFPLIWSYLICWTYINYSFSSYSESLIVVAVEYMIVIGLLVYESRNWRKQQADAVEL